MLETAYIVSFTGMILLPILAWIYFAHKFKLSWKLLLAGGLAFIVSQIPHIPLTIALTPALKNRGIIADAIMLGLLAGTLRRDRPLYSFQVHPEEVADLARRYLRWSGSWWNGGNHPWHFDGSVICQNADPPQRRLVYCAKHTGRPTGLSQATTSRILVYPDLHCIARCGGENLCDLPTCLAVGHGLVWDRGEQTNLVWTGCVMAHRCGWSGCISRIAKSQHADDRRFDWADGNCQHWTGLCIARKVSGRRARNGTSGGQQSVTESIQGSEKRQSSKKNTCSSFATDKKSAEEKSPADSFT